MPETQLRPIGVFDSGVGGISVLNEIRRLLPDEDLVYVADSGNCPYGLKSYDFIRARACAITRFLVQQGARAIVVACNTATAAAIDSLRVQFAELPLVGLEPAVKPAAAVTKTGVVGVLATGAMLGAERFEGLASRFAHGIELITQPCPGLAEQVEAGDLDGPRTRDMLHEYVAPLLARRADTLVLGCTHYPFLRATITEVAGPDVILIDTGEAVARQLVRVLPPGQHGRGSARAYSSDLSVAPVLERLWGAPLDVQALPA